MRNNSHYAIQGHSKSLILVPIESPCNFLLAINTNLHPISHRFQLIADYCIVLYCTAAAVAAAAATTTTLWGNKLHHFIFAITSSKRFAVK